jgi:holo-[acyl-carrier protein] synthase
VIAGIGVDLCEVDRIRRAMTRPSGARFRARVFTAGEQAACESERGAVRWESYAARFAAKEAVMKALGTGWRDGITFTDVEVVRAPGEAPTIRLHGVAATVAHRLGVACWHVSLSHTGAIAVAAVVAEARVRKAATSRPDRTADAAGGSARRRPTRRPPAR